MGSTECMYSRSLVCANEITVLHGKQQQVQWRKATRSQAPTLTVCNAACSAATLEEEQVRMLHPERYERATEVLSKAPSGDTEFTSAQQAGGSGEAQSAAEAPSAAEPPSRAEELWDESFKPPSALARADSPTSTLADRFVSAGGLRACQLCMSLQTWALHIHHGMVQCTGGPLPTLAKALSKADMPVSQQS